MFEKGQVLEVKIDDISDMGQGIGHVDGFTVFVSDSLPGDLVRAELTKVKKRFAIARRVELVEASPDRVEPACEYADKCGGCMLMGFGYEAQLRLKQRQVKARIERLGGVTEPMVRDTIGMDEPFRYRNKVVMHVDTDGSVGFFRPRSKDVVDCADCMIQMPPAAAAAEALREFIGRGLLKKGEWIKQMTVRTAIGTGEVMVILDSSELAEIETLAELLDDAIYEAGCLLSDNDEFRCLLRDSDGAGGPFSNAVVKNGYSLESIYIDDGGKKPVLAAGKLTIDEEMAGIRFEVSPRSFYQVNPVMMEKLYDIATDYADIKEGDTILDLYCGAGSIGLWMLKRFRERKASAEVISKMTNAIGSSAGSEAASSSESTDSYNEKNFDEMSEIANEPFVLGIETEMQAILDANRNAVINRVVNARYIPGKAEEVLPELVDAVEKYDETIIKAATNARVAVIDPPRSGCRSELIDAVCRIAPERIVYVSCDPATLARDIKLFAEGGYEFKEATPVDMFAHSGHVESVCLLSRVKE